MDSPVGHIVAHPPPPGHRIRFWRLDGTTEIDLRDLHGAAGRLAGALHRRGVRRGDRIGILAGNGPEWVLLDLAGLRLGAVTVGFDPARFEAEPALLDRYELAVLFAAGPAGERAGIVPLERVTRLAADPGPAPPPVRYSAGDPTTLKLTSGSTGTPKAMTASVGSIDAALRNVQEMFGHGAGDDLFVFLPLAILQQRYWIYSALYFGHDVTVCTYQAAFPALSRTRPTVVMGVPGFYQSARRHIEAHAGGGAGAQRAAARALFGDRIRYLWTGSAPASAATLRFFTDLGMPIYEGYGLNEACIVTKNHPGACREGSVGRPLPGKEILLDGDGVISIRSAYPVARGYTYAPPGESERVFRPGGVVRTGDVGRLDADGFLYVTGRADDVIVLDNGRKVVVRPLEEHMAASPAIDECVIFCPTQTHLVAVVSPARLPADRAAIAEQLARTNAAFGPDEQISRVVVARERFSVGNGLLSAQLKPRRRRIHDTYRDQITEIQGSAHAH